MSSFQLAQLNIGIIRGPMDSPVMADFAANLDRINAVAEATPGFVWRLQTEEGDATSIRPFENENMLVNMSVWRDVESLNRYVYRSAHVEVMRRRHEWFERMDEAFLVLWWVPAGHHPGLEEALAKLQLLRSQGPTADAFTFRQPFGAPEVFPRESVVQFLNRFEEIAGREDFDLIADMIHENAYFRFNDGDFVGRQAVRAAFEKTWKGGCNIRKERFYLSDIVVMSVDSASATATYTYNWEGAMDGRDFRIQGRGTRVIVMEQGRFQIIHEHLSPFPKQK